MDTPPPHAAPISRMPAAPAAVAAMHQLRSRNASAADLSASASSGSHSHSHSSVSPLPPPVAHGTSHDSLVTKGAAAGKRKRTKDSAVHRPIWACWPPARRKGRRRRSPFLPPYDLYFCLYLFSIVVAALGIILLVIPSLPPNEWATANAHAAAAASSPLAVAVADPPTTQIFAKSVVAARATLSAPAASPPPPPAPAPALPAGYWATVGPVLRPLTQWVLLPCLVLGTMLTVVVGHLDVEDPVAAAAPVARRVPIDEVQGSLMADDAWCRVCQTTVGKRTRHCRRCDVCVATFDHHCQFLNCCVGERNYRPFLLLVTVGFISLIIGGAVAAHLCVLYATNPTLLTARGSTVPIIGSDAWPSLYLLGIWSMYLLASSILVAWLLGFHLRLQWHGGVTTYEWLIRERQAALKRERDRDLPAWAQYPSDANLDYNPWTVDVPELAEDGDDGGGSRKDVERAIALDDFPARPVKGAAARANDGGVGGTWRAPTDWDVTADTAAPPPLR
ncbi:hypothetical protein GGF32_006324 [Allomyces javanicus]|nr:hypothetical protein GGF32_006324 [Allomyces javanicus]